MAAIFSGSIKEWQQQMLAKLQQKRHELVIRRSTKHATTETAPDRQPNDEENRSFDLDDQGQQIVRSSAAADQDQPPPPRQESAFVDNLSPPATFHLHNTNQQIKQEVTTVIHDVPTNNTMVISTTTTSQQDTGLKPKNLSAVEQRRQAYLAKAKAKNATTTSKVLDNKQREAVLLAKLDRFKTKLAKQQQQQRTQQLQHNSAAENNNDNESDIGKTGSIFTHRVHFPLRPQDDT